MSKTAQKPEVERAITLFLDALRKNYAVDEVRLYGSRARGDFHADSDVDLAMSCGVGEWCGVSVFSGASRAHGLRCVRVSACQLSSSLTLAVAGSFGARS